MPDISVLMSTVTVDAWLTEAAESILDQRDVSLELVLVLDGVHAVSEPAWMHDRRVKTIVNPSRSGLAGALRLAARHGEGEFLARMDADDVSVGDRLSRTQQYLESHPDVAVVGTSAGLIDSSGRVVGKLESSPGDDVRPALVMRNRLVHPSVMMRRSAHDRAGGYDPRLGQMEDYDLWLRMALVGRVAVLPERLLLYRVHANQMSRRARPYGAHVAAVSRGQYRLGRALGMSVPGAASAAVNWRLAQFARYYGLLRPGYDRAARVDSPADGDR